MFSTAMFMETKSGHHTFG